MVLNDIKQNINPPMPGDWCVLERLMGAKNKFYLKHACKPTANLVTF